MYINSISTTFQDYPDNESLSAIVYFYGCSHNCPDCQNKEFQTYDESNYITAIDLIKQIRQVCYDNRTNKIVFSGGDPLYSYIEKGDMMIRPILNFLNWKEYEVAIYTGYNIHDVKKSGLKDFKFIKCGVYDKNLKQESKKTDEYIQFASTNQKLYDKNYKLISRNGIYYFKGDNA